MRQHLQGDDKVLTLSHCRFEAKATHGIENIIVADFDEFIFCPQADLTAQSQYQQLAAEISIAVKSGIDQLAFPQLVPSNKTLSTRDCVIEKALSNDSTIFDCYGSRQFPGAFHSIKSVHVGHKCPLTGYHQSCGTGEAPRAYDCICSTARKLDWQKTCNFIHFSSNNNVFGQQSKYKYSQDMISQKILPSVNEIGAILYHKIN